ncbi:MAG: hypothetical protein WB950_18525, partial [Acidobacteriaceae bacterium]
RYGKQVVLDTGSVAGGSTTPLDDSTDAKDFAPEKNAASPDSSEPSATSASSAKTTNKKIKHIAPSAHTSTTHHNSTTHNAHHTPERGHPVKHPLMHVVSGT